MPWEIEYTDDFYQWWDSLTEAEQDSVAHHVKLLEEMGVHLTHPYCSKVIESKHANMRELRPQHEGRPYRVLYAFDPRRVAILLIGGDKTGNDRWYEIYVPLADKIYDEHLKEIGEK